jgi:hypothetical protein
MKIKISNILIIVLALVLLFSFVYASYQLINGIVEIYQVQIEEITKL